MHTAVLCSVRIRDLYFYHSVSSISVLIFKWELSIESHIQSLQQKNKCPFEKHLFSSAQYMHVIPEEKFDLVILLFSKSHKVLCHSINLTRAFSSVKI